MATKRMAWDTAHYLGILSRTGDAETETIKLMGVGIKSLNRSPSPIVSESAYINDKNGSPTITGYSNTFPVEYDDIVDDDAIAALQSVAEEQKTGIDAEFYYYRVDLTSDATGKACKAKRYRVICNAGDETNAATQIVTAACTLQQIGNFTSGTFNRTTEPFTFTPDGAATE